MTVTLIRSVQTYTNAASFPATGGYNVIYIDLSTAVLYYWTGSAYASLDAAPSGAAGGDLSGTFPNPTVAKVAGVTPGTGSATALGVNVGAAGAFVVNGSTGTNMTLAGTTTISGGQILNTRVVTAAGAVTVTSADYIVIVNKTVGAATTVNLPAGVTNTVFVIKDGKGDANSNNITITPAAGNIDGSGTYVINANYGSVTLVYNGTIWNIL